MLEFIVLGQVPGTGFVLTFSWVIAFAAVFFGVNVLYYEHKKHDAMHQAPLEEIAL